MRSAGRRGEEVEAEGGEAEGTTDSVRGAEVRQGWVDGCGCEVRERETERQRHRDRETERRGGPTRLDGERERERER